MKEKSHLHLSISSDTKSSGTTFWLTHVLLTSEIHPLVTDKQVNIKLWKIETGKEIYDIFKVYDYLWVASKRRSRHNSTPTVPSAELLLNNISFCYNALDVRLMVHIENNARDNRCSRQL